MPSETGSRLLRVVLHVCGGIAAYKACDLVRELQRSGCELRVAMTRDACRFVGATSFEALSGHPVTCGLFGQDEGPIPHISLSEWAEVQVVAPATADLLAKMAAGIADDAVSATLLAADGPVVVAPAMNVRMWEHAATQANVSLLEGRGVRVVRPVSGRLACGDVGAGKLAPVAEIARGVLRALGGLDRAPAQGLAGRRIVVTAGPTHEAIDPVRFIANASSGKMGYAIASEATRRGAEVTLVSGPVSLAVPEGVRMAAVTSAAEMHEATLAAFADADAAICAAAVADFTPAHPAVGKIKKSTGGIDRIELVPTADILAELSASKGKRVVVGFAAETGGLLANARAKLESKGCDLIVANDVSRPDSAFGSETDAVTLVWSGGVEPLPLLPKAEVARVLLDRVSTLLGERGAL